MWFEEKNTEDYAQRAMPISVMDAASVHYQPVTILCAQTIWFQDCIYELWLVSYVQKQISWWRFYL